MERIGNQRPIQSPGMAPVGATSPVGSPAAAGPTPAVMAATLPTVRSAARSTSNDRTNVTAMALSDSLSMLMAIRQSSAREMNQISAEGVRSQSNIRKSAEEARKAAIKAAMEAAQKASAFGDIMSVLKAVVIVASVAATVATGGLAGGLAAAGAALILGAEYITKAAVEMGLISKEDAATFQLALEIAGTILVGAAGLTAGAGIVSSSLEAVSKGLPAFADDLMKLLPDDSPEWVQIVVVVAITATSMGSSFGATAVADATGVLENLDKIRELSSWVKDLVQGAVTATSGGLVMGKAYYELVKTDKEIEAKSEEDLQEQASEFIKDIIDAMKARMKSLNRFVGAATDAMRESNDAEAAAAASI